MSEGERRGWVLWPGDPRRTESLIGTVRDVDVALDVVLHGLVLIGDEEIDPGKILQQQCLDLLVDSSPLLLIGDGDALVDQLIDRRVE